MKTKQKQSQPVDNQQRANSLLEKALKQPGLKDAMEMFDASQAYLLAVTEFNGLLERHRTPSFFTSGSCNFTEM